MQQYNNTGYTYVINVNVNKILPMDKNSTQLMEKKSVLRGEQQVQPKKSTIEFLKQFARAYSYNKQMPMELGNFIANQKEKRIIRRWEADNSHRRLLFHYF